jgi:putative NADH-flavin reductase
MKLTVFGGTGAAGRGLIEQALEGGYEVTAFARNPSKIALRHARLTILQGELEDEIPIENSLIGAGAAVSLLGPGAAGDYRSKPLARGTQNIIDAMKKLGIRWLIAVATPSARAPDDLPELKFRILVSIIRTAMRPAYDEIVGISQAARASELDWTIVRVSTLNNKPGSGKIRVGYLGRGEVGAQISRADMAGFILDELKNGRYIGKMPVISN